jgi:hypothetical protein
MLSIGRKIGEICAISAHHRSLLATFIAKKRNQVAASFYLKTFHSSKKPIPILEESRIRYQKVEGKLFCKFSVSTSWGRLS